jgi:hypothetical protein
VFVRQTDDVMPATRDLNTGSVRILQRFPEDYGGSDSPADIRDRGSFMFRGWC